MLGRWGKSHGERHDTVRKVDHNGKASIWRRKCSGYARRRQGPKLMNRCKTEKVDTKEYGKIVNRSVILDEEMVPCQECDRMEN